LAQLGLPLQIAFGILVIFYFSPKFRKPIGPIGPTTTNCFRDIGDILFFAKIPKAYQ
jgi:hypothetical protein